jgi:predicted acylesterase/phospholipase RssA
MRRALVLSGGGAKGVWQVGACHHLIVERRYWFDVIAGVSAGAVNGAALAPARDLGELERELEHLRSVWFGVRGSCDIYRRRPFGALGMVLGRRSSLHEVGPLRRVLEQHLDPPRVAASPIRLRVGYVDLLSGHYRAVGNDHPALVDAVLASCALPLVFPPVPVRTGTKVELGVDGGVHSVTPLMDALDALGDAPAAGEPDEVWVLTPDPVRRIRRSAVGHWLEVAVRSLCRLTDESLADTVRGRDVTLRVLSSRRDLRGQSLDFDPAKLRAWHDDGLRTARETDMVHRAA